MTDNWKDVRIGRIGTALIVPFGTGHIIHKNRPLHGLVFNLKGADKIYYFDDGTEMFTGGLELFYLPQGSSYRVEHTSTAHEGCYAINFEITTPFSDKPFTVRPRDHETVRKLFKSAVAAWERRTELSELGVVRQLYDIIYTMLVESEREYMGSCAAARIAEAKRIISERFSDPTLTVAELAAVTGVSGAYFRRLFTAVHGVLPKEYIAKLREAKAKELLIYDSLPIADVAKLSGYSDACHFSREFKRRVGVSPQSYRRGDEIE